MLPLITDILLVIACSLALYAIFKGNSLVNLGVRLLLAIMIAGLCAVNQWWFALVAWCFIALMILFALEKLQNQNSTKDQAEEIKRLQEEVKLLQELRRAQQAIPVNRAIVKPCGCGAFPPDDAQFCTECSRPVVREYTGRTQQL